MNPILEQIKERSPNTYGTTPTYNLKPKYLSGFERKAHVVKSSILGKTPLKKNIRKSKSLTLSVPIQIPDCNDLKARDSLTIKVKTSKVS